MSELTAAAALNDALYSYLLYLSTNQTVTVDQVVSEEEVTDPVVLRFSLDDIFENIKMRTSKAGKNAKGPKGEPLFEIMAATDDDRDWFDMALKSAIGSVYPSVAHLTKETSGYVLDSSPVITPYLTGDVVSGSYYSNDGKIYLCIKDATDPSILDLTVFTEQPYYVDSTGYLTILIIPTENSNGSMLALAEASFMDSLVNALLVDWWKMGGDVNRAQLSAMDLVDSINKIKSGLYFRNKPMRKNPSIW